MFSSRWRYAATSILSTLWTSPPLWARRGFGPSSWCLTWILPPPHHRDQIPCVSLIVVELSWINLEMFATIMVLVSYLSMTNAYVQLQKGKTTLRTKRMRERLGGRRPRRKTTTRNTSPRKARWRQLQPPHPRSRRWSSSRPPRQRVILALWLLCPTSSGRSPPWWTSTSTGNDFIF